MSCRFHANIKEESLHHRGNFLQEMYHFYPSPMLHWMTWILGGFHNKLQMQYQDLNPRCTRFVIINPLFFSFQIIILKCPFLWHMNRLREDPLFFWLRLCVIHLICFTQSFLAYYSLAMRTSTPSFSPFSLLHSLKWKKRKEFLSPPPPGMIHFHMAWGPVILHKFSHLNIRIFLVNDYVYVRIKMIFLGAYRWHLSKEVII